MNYNDQLEKARTLAIRQHHGDVLTLAERQKINYWVDLLGPEGFYCDGEIFAVYA